MSYCTTRKEDWTRFWDALRGLDFLDILHTGKNIVVEELRRLGLKVRGKSC
jgi:hypothetical protein